MGACGAEGGGRAAVERRGEEAERRGEGAESRGFFVEWEGLADGCDDVWRTLTGFPFLRVEGKKS